MVIVGSAAVRRVRRGEIWLATLDPTLGSEIRKTRPCLIISPPEIHDHVRTILAAPMTTAGFPAPFRVPIDFEGKRGLVLLDRIRALDKQRLVRRLGPADPKVLSLCLSRLGEMFEE